MKMTIKRAKRRSLEWRRKGRSARSKVPLGTPLHRVRAGNTGEPRPRLVERKAQWAYWIIYKTPTGLAWQPHDNPETARTVAEKIAQSPDISMVILAKTIKTWTEPLRPDEIEVS